MCVDDFQWFEYVSKFPKGTCSNSKKKMDPIWIRFAASDVKIGWRPYVRQVSNMRFLIRLQGYKVYYTMNPNQPEASWDSQMVDNSELTTISELTPLAIYTVRVQAFTSMGAGPMSNPVKVKTQQGPYKWISLFHCKCSRKHNHSSNLNDNN